MKPVALLFLALLSLGISQDHEIIWLTNFDETRKKAQKEDKPIMMRFQGSDWCANCIRLDTVLFEKKIFIDYAKDRFIPIVLDFPAREENKLPKAQAKHNQKLLEKYNGSRAFPALIILTKEGEVIGAMNVAPNTAESYIEQLRKIVE